MTETTVKSRDLSLTDFYSILQQEYISYYIRSKIYPAEYADKYKNYCICKKEKIEKISQKNSLPSIFNSKSIKDRFLAEFFTEYGVPNFQYRDENSVRIMGKYDKIYYFKEGVSIKIRDNGDMFTTVVVKNIASQNSIVATLNGVTRQFGYEYISRLISDNLTDF